MLVLCIDRDDDLGKKANIVGPVVGRKNNLNMAAKLALADPEDSDVNSIFAAVKKYDEIKSQFEEVEVATLAGDPSRGFKADRNIYEQLDSILEKFKADGAIFVTDGADDDQLIPIIQGRLPILSKLEVTVKQARQVESTFYTIMEALKDPFLARVVFGIPGVILIMYAALYYLNQSSLFFQAIAFILGVYLILKGTGLEEKIVSGLVHVTSGISVQRTSFPLYIAVIFIFGFGLLSAYNSYLINIDDALLAFSEAFGQVVAFTAMSALVFLLARSIDAIYTKRAYYFRTYFLSVIFVMLMWFIIVVAKEVVIGNVEVNIFLLSIFASFIIAVLTFQVSSVFDIRRKITRLLVGLPVYSEDGSWAGKIEKIDKKRKIIEYMDKKTKKAVSIKKDGFKIKDGRIFLNKQLS